MYIGNLKCIFFILEQYAQSFIIFLVRFTVRVLSIPVYAKARLSNLHYIYALQLPILGLSGTLRCPRKKWFCYGNRIRDNK